MSIMSRRVFITRTECEEPTIQLLRDGNFEVEVYDKPGKCPPEVLKEKLRSGVSALLVFCGDVINSEVIDAGKDLRVVSTFSVGFDHLDVEYVKSKGVIGTNTPGAVSVSTAETALVLILMVLKRVQECQSIMRTYEGTEAYFPPAWVLGNNLNRRVVRILGLGRIGLEIAKRVLPFGPQRIMYSGRSGPKEGVEFAEYVSFQDLISQSGVLIIACSLNPVTKHLVDKEVFKNMKNSAVVINIARGGIIEQDDMVEALKSNQIAGAGIDVMTPEPLSRDHSLMNMSNVVVFPHIGTNTVETRLDMGKMAAENIINALNPETKEVTNRIA
uniref:Glyoxylate reductase/hydroxypyruvate reductase n=1 Tax=Caligus rogercresseyi TaxID=217165 RepID=C1BP27_CALRO|nr:Glyoxylate reductase/hydroxypyruvate reductase [Caligus rogercresseyi]